MTDPIPNDPEWIRGREKRMAEAIAIAEELAKCERTKRGPNKGRYRVKVDGHWYPSLYRASLGTGRQYKTLHQQFKEGKLERIIG